MGIKLLDSANYKGGIMAKKLYDIKNKNEVVKMDLSSETITNIVSQILMGLPTEVRK